MTRHLTLLLALSALCLTLTGCKSKSVVSQPAPISIQSLDKSAVESAILSALPRRSWEPVEKQGNVITARNIVRGKHIIEVAINYAGDEVTIEYVNSHNMDYREEGGVQYIHENYNNWVAYLRQDIAAAIGPLRI